MSGIFGIWDAPVVDGMRVIATPVNYSCRFCQEAIKEGDNGALWYTDVAEHRECCLRTVTGGIGHLIDHEAFCGSELGPDAGLSYRHSALLVWERIVNGKQITPEELLAEVQSG